MEEKNAPLISVIIPVYNVEKYVGRCLDSVIGNTYKNLEIICVNDGSTDGGLEVLKEYAAKDSRIKIIDKPNGGLASARNAGIDAATGEYVAHVDSDDWIHRRYFEIFIKALEKCGDSDAVIFNLISTSDTIEDKPIDADSLHYDAGGIELLRKYRFSRVYIWGRVYKRSLIGDFRQPLNVSMGEDRIFNLSVIGKKRDVKLTVVDDAYLYYYFKREGSIVHSSNVKGLLPAAEYVFERLDTFDIPYSKLLASEFVMKWALKTRYLSMFEDRAHPELKRDYKKLVKGALSVAESTGMFSKSKKLMYKTFVDIPFSYRLYSILQDRTMLKWEREEKARVRKGK